MLQIEAITLIRFIKSAGYKPNGFEHNFMNSILNRGGEGTITYKQHMCLTRIYEKSSGGGRYQRREITPGRTV